MWLIKRLLLWLSYFSCGCSVCDHMVIVRQLDLHLNLQIVQSVSITTKVLNCIPTCDKVYLIQHYHVYVIKFVSNLLHAA